YASSSARLSFGASTGTGPMVSRSRSAPPMYLPTSPVPRPSPPATRYRPVASTPVLRLLAIQSPTFAMRSQPACLHRTSRPRSTSRPVSPCLEILHTSHDQQGQPFEVTSFVMRSDRTAVVYEMPIAD